MTISTLVQTIEVTDPDLVTVTDITEDTENNTWVREIRAYTVSAGTTTLIFALRLVASTEDAIKITAPTQQF